MRRTTNAILVFVCTLAWPAAGSAQPYTFTRTYNAMAQGFGGLTFDSARSATFGGNIAVSLTDNLQIVGEGGYFRDIKPSLLQTALDFTPYDVRVSAFSGEGGVRFVASPRSAVSPYGEATAGFARLSAGVGGLGSRGALVDTALGFFNRTEPLLGVGAGVLLQSGPLVVDVGYRYKKISGGNSLESFINRGTAFNVSQMRVGVGVRF
jgi:opacity protein-like surface antigen